jgi:acyl-coenzyme A synthetase/AMP-(fatty) acid ligase
LSSSHTSLQSRNSRSQVSSWFVFSSFRLWAIANTSQVPPIIINMIRSQDVCSKYDLNSVKTLFTGAAPLGMETAADFQKIYPNVLIRQGYGKT